MRNQKKNCERSEYVYQSRAEIASTAARFEKSQQPKDTADIRYRPQPIHYHPSAN
jgi:hypothetical protein